MDPLGRQPPAAASGAGFLLNMRARLQERAKELYLETLAHRAGASEAGAEGAADGPQAFAPRAGRPRALTVGQGGAKADLPSRVGCLLSPIKKSKPEARRGGTAKKPVIAARSPRKPLFAARSPLRRPAMQAVLHRRAAAGTLRSPSWHARADLLRQCWTLHSSNGACIRTFAPNAQGTFPLARAPCRSPQAPLSPRRRPRRECSVGRSTWTTKPRRMASCGAPGRSVMFLCFRVCGHGGNERQRTPHLQATMYSKPKKKNRAHPQASMQTNPLNTATSICRTCVFTLVPRSAPLAGT
eukprot:Tamp_23578.p1 GENE.Tamp_23578~~Tamp_23578.p1  ORF type:complete len:298 (-),score=5.29 Tamp_23578:134-1027(-)